MRRSRPAPLLLAFLALVASLLNAASPPHLHVGVEPGYYNQEHDLVAFATTGAGALLEVAVADGPLATPMVRAVIARATAPLAPVRSLAEPRAPPAA